MISPSVACVLLFAGLRLSGAAPQDLRPDDPHLKPALQAWYRADSLGYEDRADVYLWPDESGHGRDLAATAGPRQGGTGKPPKFAAASKVNSRPAVRFDPSSGLAASPDRPVEIRGDAALTIILVAVLEPNKGKGSYDGVLGIGNPASPRNPGRPMAALVEIERTKSGDPQLDLAGGWGHDASLGPRSMKPLYGRPIILSIVKRPGPMAASTRFFINGRESRKTSGSKAIPDVRHRRDVGLWMGRAMEWCGSFRGDVAEVIVYNKALADADRAAVERGLAERHSIWFPHMLERIAARFTEREKSHWAFQPVKDAPAPEVRDRDWPASPIDRFILARLEAGGLAPAPPAGRRTLIRRATFDLTGLPPAPEDVDAFVNDPDPDGAAFSKVVDRLLASPHYGERWGRRWLDVVRYADTTANDGNFVMRYAWRYRDYVVEAFNRDTPYDRFIVEQLAGDLLPHDGDPRVTAERTIATGFLMVGPKALAETDKEQVKLDIADEQIDVTGRAFLGLTLGCARCHDHKFDPIPTVDYYSLAGIFRSTEVFSDLVRNASKWLEVDVSMGKDRKPLPVMAPRDGTPVNLRVHRRGDRFNLGPPTPRRFLQILAGEGHAPLETSGSGRLELARWIASPGNPLTARVMANRIWQGHFGRGLVATSGNFGARGDRPSHPRLLDRLAKRFVASGPSTPLGAGPSTRLGAGPSTRLGAGWSVKAMHRLMMLSSTYRQSSRPASGPADPGNRLLGRMPRLRLDAEQVRDAILAVSGRLDRRMGGGELVQEVFAKGEAVDRKRGVVSAATLNSAWEGFDTPRRSLYLPVIRNGQPDILALFDAADANQVTPVRNETTVASQAAFLMNNPFVREQALRFARSLPSGADRLDRATVRALGRPPTPAERADAGNYLKRYAEQAQASGRSKEEAREAAWQSFCQFLFCLNEFIYVD